MADDLEAFLRQAAQRRAARRKPPEKPSEPRSQPVSQAPEPQIAAFSSRFMRWKCPKAIRPKSSMPKSCRQYLPNRTRWKGTCRIDRFCRARRTPGSRGWAGGRKMTARLHRKFDHRLGTFDDSPGMPDEPVAIATNRCFQPTNLPRCFKMRNRCGRLSS